MNPRSDMQICRVLSKSVTVSEWLKQVFRTLKDQKKDKQLLQLIKKHETHIHKDIDLTLTSANLLRQKGYAKDSLNILKKAILSHGTENSLIHSIAKSYLSCEEYTKAKTLLNQLVRNRYELFAVWFDIGVCCCQLNNREESLNAFNKCICIKPKHRETIKNKIAILIDLNRLKEARLCLNEAFKANKLTNSLLPTEACLLIAEGDLHGALKILTNLCSTQPEQPLYWLDLAATHRGLRRYINADKILRMGFIYSTNHHSLKHAFIQSLCESGKLEASRRLLRKINIEKTIGNDMHVFNLQFLGASYTLLSDEERSNLAKSWGRVRGIKEKSLWMSQNYTATSKRRIKVGYLSSDYCNHPVAHFLLPIIKNHNKDIIEFWCISTGNIWDKKSEEVKKHSEHWIDLYGTSDLIAAKAIMELKLDILVELGGYTYKSRLGICLHNPAKHQISYLGFPGATYLKNIPWWIGDNTLFKNLSNKDKESHKLLIIKKGYMCLPKPTNSAKIERTSNNGFYYGSFNHIRKLTDETIELWATILKGTPTAKLAIKSICFKDKREKERLHERFMKQNINSQRLILLDYSKSHKKHMESYNLIDVALDPIPYGGATTTAEAIWMGVPVLCIHGKGMVGSLSASILTAANMVEFICDTREEYISRAISLYRIGVRDTDMRKKITSTVESSDFNQPKRLTQNLEQIYYKVAET